MSAPSVAGPKAQQVPDALGRFGPFGGRFVPETLMVALNQLADEYARAKADPAFQAELETPEALRRPALAAVPRRAADRAWPAGPRSTSSAKTSTTPAPTRSTTRSARRCSPCAWARTRVIAETGAGQHGVATATACALFGLECVVYMGEEDIRRQKLERLQHEALGAEVVPGHQRLAHAPRRHQRGDARLDGQRRARRTTSSAPSSARTRSR